MMGALGLFGTFAMTELTLHPSFLMSIPIPNLIAWKMLPEKHFLHQYICLSVYDSIPWGRGVLLLRYHLRWIDDVIMQWRIQGGGGGVAGHPLFLDQNDARRTEKRFCETGPSSPSRPPLPYIKVRIRHCRERLCIACLIDSNKWPILINSPFRVLYFPCFCGK